MGYIFEWDPKKADLNFLKHGVTFEDATTVFEDEDSQTAYDYTHSKKEDRYIVVGKANDGTMLTIIFTERNEKTRIISARRSSTNERSFYETKRKK